MSIKTVIMCLLGVIGTMLFCGKLLAGCYQYPLVSYSNWLPDPNNACCEYRKIYSNQCAGPGNYYDNCVPGGTFATRRCLLADGIGGCLPGTYSYSFFITLRAYGPPCN